MLFKLSLNCYKFSVSQHQQVMTSPPDIDSTVTQIHHSHCTVQRVNAGVRLSLVNFLYIHLREKSFPGRFWKHIVADRFAQSAVAFWIRSFSEILHIIDKM